MSTAYAKDTAHVCKQVETSAEQTQHLQACGFSRDRVLFSPPGADHSEVSACMTTTPRACGEHRFSHRREPMPPRGRHNTKYPARQRLRDGLLIPSPAFLLLAVTVSAAPPSPAAGLAPVVSFVRACIECLRIARAIARARANWCGGSLSNE